MDCAECNKKQGNQNSRQSDKGIKGLQKIGHSLKFIKLTEKKSLNTKPSPLAAARKSLPEVRPRKRALLIAVSYKGQKYELKGTINDAKTMKNWLISYYAFKAENILIFTEEESDEELRPTKKNIQIGMKWLVEDCQAGDSLVFYFSGHGIRQPDFDGDERDGFDETICPVDFMASGMILDNEIFSTIVRPLTKGVTLHGIVDACHSGTMLDLPFVYNREAKKWEDNSPPSGAVKQTRGGLAITFTACRDDQMAADTNAFSDEDMKMSGALTFTLTDSIEKKREIVTYGELLDDIYNAIEKADQQFCGPVRILQKLLNKRLLQKPQLSASEAFNVYEKQFVL